MSYEYRQYRYLLMTLDPTHIGTGGYRLGRVDNSITREPGTNLPKIPGTSLSGAIRSYAAYRYGERDCAGQGQESETSKGHCGQPECPICYTFGHTRGDRSYSGTVHIFDAHLAFFPVHSMTGPVWVSSYQRLEDLQFRVSMVSGERPKDDRIATTWGRSEPLNLGWLLLPVDNRRATVQPPEGSGWENAKEWQAIQNRIVLVDDPLFSQIVNSNLEVLISVSIDPATGAAQKGALFTYEAIPRAAFLACDVVEDDYRHGFPSADYLLQYVASHEVSEEKRQVIEQRRARIQPLGWATPQQVVRAGLEWAEALGVGGMGTRGFGRLRLVDHPWPVSARGTASPQKEEQITPTEGGGDNG